MNAECVRKPLLIAVLICLVLTPCAYAGGGLNFAAAASDEVDGGPSAAVDGVLPEGQAELPPEPLAALSYPDPIEPWNRAMYHVNDKLYFWVLKPAAQGYEIAVPELVRLSVREFFRNLTTPIRLVSAVLEGRMRSAGVELARFGINSTAGIAGLFDIAKFYHLEREENDIGITLGCYGLRDGPFIIWPVIGPSSVRDSVGLVGNYFLDPVSYVTPLRDSLALRSLDYLTDVSLSLGEYEDFKESAVEPYTALRNAYLDHRRSVVSASCPRSAAKGK